MLFPTTTSPPPATLFLCRLQQTACSSVYPSPHPPVYLYPSKRWGLYDRPWDNPKFSSLALYPPSSANCSLLPRGLSRPQAPNLAIPQTFSLSFNFDKIRPLTEPQSLSRLPYLERIILSFRNFTPDKLDVATSTLHKILRMIDTITSFHFCTTVINLLDYNGTEALHDQWNKLDDLLSTDKFATCSVELFVSPGENELAFYPKVNRKGRLSVVHALFPWDPRSDDDEHSLAQEEMEWVCNQIY
ncbi:hypothetical protein PM082_012624 [Marasmius tenuissimus]|nr:hypothetical protein PM082_012624 [Marasmius tenuissimus]